MPPKKTEKCIEDGCNKVRVPANDTCSTHTLCYICFDPLLNERCILECSHIYHSRCIQEWNIYKDTCPQCRSSLRCVNHKTHSKSLLEFVVQKQKNYINSLKILDYLH